MGQYNQFVLSLRRLYKNHSVTEATVTELCLKYKLSEEEKNFILGHS